MFYKKFCIKLLLFYIGIVLNFVIFFLMREVFSWFLNKKIFGDNIMGGLVLIFIV